MDRGINIIPGEAPESDDEENVTLPRATAKLPVSVGIAISGEAPESDSYSSSSEAEDVVQKEGVRSAARVLSPVKCNTSLKEPKIINIKDSLLHRKLRERNMLFRKGVEDFVNHTADTTTKDLNSIDQHLLKSQVTLQEAASSLRHFQANLSEINSKLALSLSISLPNINTDVLQL